MKSISLRRFLFVLFVGILTTFFLFNISSANSKPPAPKLEITDDSTDETKSVITVTPNNPDEISGVNMKVDNSSKKYKLEAKDGGNYYTATIPKKDVEQLVEVAEVYKGGKFSEIAKGKIPVLKTIAPKLEIKTDAAQDTRVIVKVTPKNPDKVKKIILEIDGKEVQLTQQSGGAYYTVSVDRIDKDQKVEVSVQEEWMALSDIVKGIIPYIGPTPAPKVVISTDPSDSSKAIIKVYPSNIGNTVYIAAKIDNVSVKLNPVNSEYYQAIVDKKDVEQRLEVSAKEKDLNISAIVKETIPVLENITTPDDSKPDNTSPDNSRPDVDKPDKPSNKDNILELSGKDRFDTSLKVSREYKSADTVILANGYKDTDILTATVLGAKIDAPVILINGNSVSAEVFTEIDRLGAKDIILSGGYSSISKAVENSLSEYDKDNVERLSGSNRFETAVEVAKKIRAITGENENSVLVDGTNFPDAVSVVSLAVSENAPILLTSPSSLPNVTIKAISDFNLSNIFIGGGSNSVSKDIEISLSNKYKVERIYGSDRYETSLAVAKRVYPEASRIVIASGEQYADALVAVPYATKNDIPTIMVAKNSMKPSVENFIKGQVTDITIVGGSNSITQTVRDRLKNLIK